MRTWASSMCERHPCMQDMACVTYAPFLFTLWIFVIGRDKKAELTKCRGCLDSVNPIPVVMQCDAMLWDGMRMCCDVLCYVVVLWCCL
eukprot:m.58331 g.58331  ORF g.58331 m.58331 type:complete len:88 (+) comp7859_c0_seq4:1209-1472(+)